MMRASAPRRTAKLVPVMVTLALAGGSFALAAGACGGSSSESPWPVEPESSVLGPAGEEAKTQGLDQVPDAGPDAAPDAAPNVEP
jgi:hypothetical protein